MARSCGLLFVVAFASLALVSASLIGPSIDDSDMDSVAAPIDAHHAFAHEFANSGDPLKTFTEFADAELRSGAFFGAKRESSQSYGRFKTSAAQICPEQVCLASGADCAMYAYNSTYFKYSCITGEYGNRTGGGYKECHCVGATAVPSRGSVCSPLSIIQSQCGPRQTCDTRDIDLTFSLRSYNCYTRKYIGDTCADSYDCLPPRVCGSNGKCQANLVEGQECYNYTAGGSRGMCPLTHYCPQPTGSPLVSVCTARIARGSSCAGVALQQACQPSLVCDLQTNTCEQYRQAYVAIGSKANETYQCQGYLLNQTDSTCIDFATNFQMYQTMYKAKPCETSLDCGPMATCDCTPDQMNAKRQCALSGGVNSIEGARQGFQFQLDAMTKAKDAGCESPTSGPDVLNRNDMSFCAVSSGAFNDYIRFQCLSFKALDPPPFQCDAQNVATICASVGAAGHSATVSFAVVVLAALSAIIAAMF